MKQKILIISGVIILLIVSLVYLYLQMIQPSKPSEFLDVLITLERTACYGTCPVYKLTISGDGKVVYEGTRYVNTTGIQTTQISQEKIKELVDEFFNMNYFALEDEYLSPVTDMPTTITSITIDGRTKKVVNYHGAPKKLDELEYKVDEIANSNKWVKGQ